MEDSLPTLQGKRSLPLITPKGDCVWPSRILVYMCFKINIDFLPFVFVPKWGERLIND